MKTSESIRNIVFWSLDFIKGSEIKKHLDDLRYSFADIDSARKKTEQRLTNILNHAVNTTPFYKKYAGFENLRDFPVIQKKTIKENYDAFISDTYDKNKHFKTSTSGSYGTPFTFFLSIEKRNRQLAEVIYFNKWAGYEVGMRYAQVRVHPKGKFYLFKQNGVLIDPSVIDNDWLEQKRVLLKKKKIRFIIAYPSAILPLAKYCRQKGDKPQDFALKGIITGAEPLLDAVSQILDETFGCINLDRYSSNELGVIAHQCPQYKKHHVNIFSHKVEILKLNSDEPALPDEIGRVAVTDLFSHAMPLIRYDTGDLSSFSSEACPCGIKTPILNKIEGRAMETIYDTSGRIINALAIDRNPKDLEGIIQFQFIQKSRDNYLVRLHVIESFNQEETLRQRYHKLLGQDANIIFEYVDSIPPLPSGKRPYIINEYKRFTET